MEYYPDAEYNFADPVFFDNGTCEVWVVVTISGQSRSMWLPVMDFKNKSIIGPSSREISDTRMRCLVKCLAMFGLAHYIYAGEDVPKADNREQVSNTPIDTVKVQNAYTAFKEEIDADKEIDYARIQAGHKRLSSDEMMAVWDLFGSQKPYGFNIGYKKIIKDCISMPLDDDGQVLRGE